MGGDVNLSANRRWHGDGYRMFAEAQLSSFVSRILRPAAHDTRGSRGAKNFHIVQSLCARQSAETGSVSEGGMNRSKSNEPFCVAFVLGGAWAGSRRAWLQWQNSRPDSYHVGGFALDESE